MTAAIDIGDKVDVHWVENARRDTGSIQRAPHGSVGAVEIALVGPPRITIYVVASRLRAVGLGRWTVDL